MKGSVADFDTRLGALLDQVVADMRRRLVEGNGLDSVRTRRDGDTTHQFDADVESVLLQLCEDSGLPIRFSSEERADVDLVASPEMIAIVDPLDGSDMLAQGYPLCSTALCLLSLETREPILSRIAEIATGIQWSANWDGPTRAGQPIRPSEVTDFSAAFVVSYAAPSKRLQALCASGIPDQPPRLLLNYGGPLDVAKVGSGHCDAVIEAYKGFAPRDLAAGLHIALAAGAVASLTDGGKIYYSDDRDERLRFVAAATRPLLDEILHNIGK